MDNNTESFDKIIEYEEKIHEKNQIRIKYGIRMMIIIPLIFLFVMFKLESSKVVFLVLWIVSLFVLAAYLIAVEYMDYQLQIKLSEFGIREEMPIKGLLKEESKVEKIIVSAGLLEDKKEKKRRDEVPQLEEKGDQNEFSPIVTDSDKLDAILRNQLAMEEENRKLRERIEEMEKNMQASKKSAQDYAAMRRTRAMEKQEKEKE